MIKKFIIPEKAHKEAARDSGKVVDMPEKVIELYVPDTNEKQYRVNIIRTPYIYCTPEIKQTATVPLSLLGVLIKNIQTAIQDTYAEGTPYTYDIIIDIMDDRIRLEIYDKYREG